MKKNNQAFTVLELLIVLAVLVIGLVGIVFPFLSKTREKPRSNCAGNLKQIGLALLLYSGENDGYFPTTPRGNNSEPLNLTANLPDSKTYGCPWAPVLMTTARNAGYLYYGSGYKDDHEAAETTYMARDIIGNHRENWMNKLYIDGHVAGSHPPY